MIQGPFAAECWPEVSFHVLRLQGPGDRDHHLPILVNVPETVLKVSAGFLYVYSAPVSS